MNTQEIGAVIGVLLVVGIGFTALMFIGGQFEAIDEETGTNYNYWTETYNITTPSDTIEVPLPQAKSIVSVTQTQEDGTESDVTEASSLSNGVLTSTVSFWENMYFMGYQTGGWAGNEAVQSDVYGAGANATASGLVRNITVLMFTWDVGNYAKCALYYESNLSLYTETLERTDGANGEWAVFNFTTLPNVTLGTRWFVMIASNGSVVISYTATDEISGQGGYYEDDETSYDPLEDPLSWDVDTTDDTYMIYATVQPYNATTLTITYERDLGNTEANTGIAFTFLFFIVILSALLLIVGVVMRYK